MKATLFKNIRFLGIPAISLISVPLLAAYWQQSPIETKKIPTPPLISSPSQLPPPPVSPPPLTQLQPPQPLLSPKPSSPVSTSQTPVPQKSPVLKTAQKPQETTKTSKKTSNTVQKPTRPIQAPTQSSYQGTPPPNLEIRVAILRDVPSTTVGVSQSASLTDRNGRILQSLSPSQGLEVVPEGEALRLGNWRLPPVLWVQPSEGGLTYVGDRWYRGKILLVSQGNRLLVINYVNLEQYLYSVVGSEMHANAPLEALKAQAIAARSYALVHIIRPASPWYDLGNTQRWQVYKGLNSEYNTGHHAVNETMGQILSYQGGVVESLYAATDEIVARAHSGRGMSQTGAYDLARQGYDHQRILGHYYPGVTLARIILNN